MTINQPGCVTALETHEEDEGRRHPRHRRLGRQIQNVKAERGGQRLLRRLVRRHDPLERARAVRQVGRLPDAGRPEAACARPTGAARRSRSPRTSKNKDAAWAYIEYALATVPGQISMLKNRGLVPSLLAGARRPLRQGAAALLGRPGDLGRHPRYDEGRSRPTAAPSSSTRCAAPSSSRSINDYLNGNYASAKEALDAAAEQISSATGLPIAELIRSIEEACERSGSRPRRASALLLVSRACDGQFAIPYLFPRAVSRRLRRLLGVADRPIGPALLPEHAGATRGTISLLVNWGRLFRDAAFIARAQEHVPDPGRAGAGDAGARRRARARAQFEPAPGARHLPLRLLRAGGRRRGRLLGGLPAPLQRRVRRGERRARPLSACRRPTG